MADMFKPLKPKKKKGIFDQRNDMLDDIYDYQQGQTKKPEDDFPNLTGKKKPKAKVYVW